jgi:hypothetical protein
VILAPPNVEQKNSYVPSSAVTIPVIQETNRARSGSDSSMDKRFPVDVILLLKKKSQSRISSPAVVPRRVRL